MIQTDDASSTGGAYVSGGATESRWKPIEQLLLEAALQVFPDRYVEVAKPLHETNRRFLLIENHLTVVEHLPYSSELQVAFVRARNECKHLDADDTLMSRSGGMKSEVLYLKRSAGQLRHSMRLYLKKHVPALHRNLHYTLKERSASPVVEHIPMLLTLQQVHGFAATNNVRFTCSGKSFTLTGRGYDISGRWDANNQLTVELDGKGEELIKALLPNVNRSNCYKPGDKEQR